MINNLKNNEVIIYDGICVLCNKYIKWVLDKDKENLFLISNLQSKFTEEKFLKTVGPHLNSGRGG